MNRQTALVLAVLLFVVFFLLSYCGSELTFYASLVIAIFASLVLLNIFYPLSQSTNEAADFTLVLYAVFEILGILILTTYILSKAFVDTRSIPSTSSGCGSV
jgi:uncharacterized protein YhhL (DUF1145 family)